MMELLLSAITSKQIENIQAVLSQGENVNARSPNGIIPLHLAILEKDEDIVKLLIEKGADVNIKNENQTALDHVLNFSNVEKSTFLKILAEAGFNLNTRSKEGGRTLLHEAATTGDVELVKFLINQGADVNAKDKKRNWTALHHAAYNVFSEDPNIFKVLLSANAEVNARGSSKETALHVLAGCSIYRSSLHGPPESPPANLPLFSLCKIVNILAKYGADFDAVDSNDYMPIKYAIGNSHLEAVKAFILSGKVDVNREIKIYSSKESILQVACRKIDLPMVKFLLKNGANVNGLDDHDDSPLCQSIIMANSYFYRDMLRKDGVQIKVLNYILKWNPDVNVTIGGQHKWNLLNLHDNDEYAVYLWQILVAHIAKLHAMGSFIHPDVLKTISQRPAYKKFFEKCCQELETAKKSKLHSKNWVTYYDILMDNKNKLLQYAGNKDLTKAFRKVKVTKKFSTYGPSIHKKFSKAVKKRKIWFQAATKLSSFFPTKVDPEHGTIVKILSFLNWKDYQKLCD